MRALPASLIIFVKMKLSKRKEKNGGGVVRKWGRCSLLKPLDLFFYLGQLKSLKSSRRSRRLLKGFKEPKGEFVAERILKAS